MIKGISTSVVMTLLAISVVSPPLASAQSCAEIIGPAGATCRDFYRQRSSWDQETIQRCGLAQVEAYKRALGISDQGWGNFLKPCGTCSIEGVVTGPLDGTLSPDHAGSKPIKVTLNSMVLRAKDVGQERRDVPLHNRSYVFQNVRAGATYEIFPGQGFRSNPARRTVTCEANIRYRNQDFKITGSPQN